MILRKRLNEVNEQQYGQAIYIGDRLVFDKEKFDKLDEEVSIIAPDTYELVYVNEYMQKSYGLSNTYSWVGEKCYKILAGSMRLVRTASMASCAVDCFYTTTRRNRKTGRTCSMRATLIPWQEELPLFYGRKYRSVYQHDLAENNVIFREVMANEVIAIGMREANPDVGLQKMLEKIGHSLQAERVLIFEEQGSQVSATYEWHQENLQPVARTVQHIPINSLRPLYDTFDTKQMAIIEDAPEFIRTHPGFHPYIPTAAVSYRAI